MLKYIKIFNDLKIFVDKSFCINEFLKIETFFTQLEKIAKINFEKAIF